MPENPSWSHFYASGPEIWGYIKRTTAKYNIDRSVKSNTKVVSSTWDMEAGKWRFKIQHSDSTIIENDADILINCTGFLSKWN